MDGPHRETSAVGTNLLTPAFLLATVAIALQMATNGRYGYFRDELYYIDLSKHLAPGYVDLAPLAPGSWH